MFFEGFSLVTQDVQGVRYRFRSGGTAPDAIFLLHGRPETHVMWHRVGPLLARYYTVICPDLHPERSPEQQVNDLLTLATITGHDKFVIVGQDYGAHLGYLTAATAPDRVQALVLMEALPAATHEGRDDMAFSLAQYNSCWFAQLHPKPESHTIPVPAEWLEKPLPAESVFAPEAVADYLSASIWQHARTVTWAAACHPIRCPVLVLWAASGRIGGWYDPVRRWCDVTSAPTEGHAINGLHFLAEEAPGDVETAISLFLEHCIPE
ncbi:alpha/beta fold hydrolase [Acetobacter oeni]|uniref:Fluoroacetate dehalogenase n=1 Tax=Acetobacter oeni TaxID=304077 RepID=A0A511XHD2_9PROT|nr:alpha/beta hydrolase [Acetobacter oeni]MBB3881202.1 haloacetate dehalogenase [Acetobacter oeni]NHO18078.1 alpha/beta fold hydrolase [Acetobacter oeni]GBR08382.1 putative hydrolase [Acetobacter oeni LMG 21952]GEN62354.1 fluoroacetate dehalogenase [Acetobacter oeni]